MKMNSLVLVLVLLGMGCKDPGVNYDAVLGVVESLENQAGVGDETRELLQHLEKIASTSAQRAEVQHHLCGVEWATRGPVVALSVCDRAVYLGDRAGGLYAVRAHTRRARVLIAMDRATALAQAHDDLALAPTLVLLNHPLPKVFWDWAHVDAALAAPKPASDQALDHASSARRTLDDLVAHDASQAEYLAIADWMLGRVWIQAREYESAWTVLSAALQRQRGLDAQHGGYAEYRLYLVRILHAMGACPGGAEHKAEAQRLARELLERDPQRYEYAQENR